MPAINPTDLTNAKLDVDHIAAIATSTEETAADRLGHEKLTVTGAVARMGWEPPVAYESGLSMVRGTQTVTYDDGDGALRYHPLPGEVPFTTSGTFETDKFAIAYQFTADDADALQDAVSGGGIAALEGLAAASTPMANYTALRAYTGTRTGVRITLPGAAGYFYRDTADTTSADNGGTVIVDAGGTRWKRLFDGAVQLSWFIGARARAEDDSAAWQAACIAAVNANGELHAGAFETVIADDTVVLGIIESIGGGLKITGTCPNSNGVRTLILQKNLNVPVFREATVGIHLSGLSFSTWAGYTVDSAGDPITCLSTTSNTMTLSANPWEGGSPVIWDVEVTATDSTVYSSGVIQLALYGAWYASGVTVNGNGTVTLTGVKGALGTLNATLASTVGQPVTAWIALAHLTDPADLDPGAGVIQRDLRENQFHDHLWFHQVTHAFTHDALGSGSGIDTGVGFAGHMSDIVCDGAMSLVQTDGDLYGLIGSNIQCYGTAIALRVAGDVGATSVPGIKVDGGKLLKAGGDVLSFNAVGAQLNADAFSGLGYSDLVIEVAGAIADSNLDSINWGRNATASCIKAGQFNNSSMVGGTALSNGEATSDPWLQLVNDCKGSTLDVNFAKGYGTSTNNRIGFSGTPNVTGSRFSPSFEHFQVGTKVIGWIPVSSFLNSWDNVGGGADTVAYYKDSGGVVRVRGALIGGAIDTVAFNLPAGFRPPAGPLRIVAGQCYSGSARQPLLLDIDTTGDVTIRSTCVSWAHMDCVSFSTVAVA